MHFHIAHVVPGKVAHGLNGYKEVIDTVQWGLRELGHSVEYGRNKLSATATNIVYGMQVLTPEVLNSLPDETIVYHFEQLLGQDLGALKPQARIAAGRFKIWDYSAANMEAWAALGARSVRVVPVGYAPVLQRIARPAVQDIDVLIYGSTGPDRLSAFHYLSQAGLTTAYICGLYGRARDDLIARSKVIVNVKAFERAKIFEIVRVSYLFANRKAVVATIDADTVIDDDVRVSIRLTAADQLVHDCATLVADDGARRALEEGGFAAIEKRDIRTILEHALASVPGSER